MKRTILTLALSLTAISGFSQAIPQEQISSSAKGFAQRYIELVDQAYPLKDAVWGVMAVNLKGDTLANFNSIQKMLPASNTKLISTGVAMATLGPDYRFETRIGYSGKIEGGILKGDVYIIGGGDPTTASKDSIAVDQDKLFAQWKSFLTKAGIKKVEGRVIGDGRFFEGQLESDGWGYEDIGTDYGAGGNGLCFYRNTQDFSVAAGAKVGDPIKLGEIYPETPWLDMKWNCCTGEAGTGDNLYLYNTDLAPVAQMRGTFAIDRKPKKENCSNKFGALTCAYCFSKYLQTCGIATKGAADIDDWGDIRTDKFEKAGKAAAVSSLKTIGTTYSPSLKRIAFITNHRSDNFYAETMMRIVGKTQKGSSVYDSCRVAFHEKFMELGVDDSHGIQLYDGSGLARKNYIAPAFFCRFLKAMMDTPVFGDYIETLGQPGTFSYVRRLKNEPQDIKDRVHMKSGSMNGVVCFSGYIEPVSGLKEDTVIFSIMTNNCPDPDDKVYPTIDKIIALLASENN